jgi:hypothetical protein
MTLSPDGDMYGQARVMSTYWWPGPYHEIVRMTLTWIEVLMGEERITAVLPLTNLSWEFSTGGFIPVGACMHELLAFT